jgi:pimeloyl-ACP methyl ester carboxylesterase
LFKYIVMQLNNIVYNTVNIRFSDEGKGKPVVLLHGYLESLEIWYPFANELIKKYRIIAIDMPGHGKTGTLNRTASVEYMAECVKAVLDHLKIDKSVIIAHSMGGYAMLAFAELWPERLNGIGLFHSVSWADLPEKREARDREIELVKQGKKQLIFNVNVPKGFANDNLVKFSNEIENAKIIAANTIDEGIIAALNGMKNRKDRTAVLEKISVPVFFGVGKKDNYIPIEKLMSLTILPKIKYIAVFENSGHMGFIEEKEYAVDEIEQFLEIC